MSSFLPVKQGGPAGVGRRKDYLTTTQFAQLYGVSRFTVINWVKQGKIRAVKTIGGHRRIPISEAISFLEQSHLNAFHGEQAEAVSDSLGHCWEYRHENGGEREEGNCRNCLVHEREIDYCFVLARQFGRDVVRCQGDCLNCSYFEALFHSSEGAPRLAEEAGGEARSQGAKRRRFLDSFAYGVGRGVHGLKETVAGIFAKKPAGRDAPAQTR